MISKAREFRKLGVGQTIAQYQRSRRKTSLARLVMLGSYGICTPWVTFWLVSYAKQTHYEYGRKLLSFEHFQIENEILEVSHVCISCFMLC